MCLRPSHGAGTCSLAMLSGMNGIAKEAKPTLVLVHGAFAESPSWDEVIRILEGQGYTAIAAANPLREPLRGRGVRGGIVRSIKGPAVLGLDIPTVVRSSPARRGARSTSECRCTSRLAPAEGENANELSQRFPGSTLERKPEARSAR